MELAGTSVVHLVNSWYPLPVNEVLFFRQIKHYFFPVMVLLETADVSTYQKHNSVDACHIFLENNPLSTLTILMY